MPVLLPPGTAYYAPSAYYGSISTGNGQFFATETEYTFGGTAWDTQVQQSYAGNEPIVEWNPVGTPLPAPQPVSYATAPVARTVLANTLHVAVVEGIRCRTSVATSLNGGADQLGEALNSTGRVRPKQVSGWTNPQNAANSDNLYATTPIPGSGYTAELAASGFDFDIPANATITGIVVRVERNKI